MQTCLGAEEQRITHYNLKTCLVVLQNNSNLVKWDYIHRVEKINTISHIHLHNRVGICGGMAALALLEDIASGREGVCVQRSC